MWSDEDQSNTLESTSDAFYHQYSLDSLSTSIGTVIHERVPITYAFWRFEGACHVLLLL